MFLVDSDLGPAPVAEEVLAHVKDKRLVAEIARFNLEANLMPQLLGGPCLRLMEFDRVYKSKLVSFSLFS